MASLPLRIPLSDLSATQRLGEAVGRTAQAGDIILLSGDLGAGKTSLTQGIARGLGIEDRVTSPTFNLLHEYHEGRVPLYHFDLYRLDAHGVMAQGFDDYWERGDGLCALEWAERLEGAPLPDHLVLSLEHAGEGRLATLTAHGPYAEAWLERIRAHAPA
ncbi:tRNA (adenosine(37)-N6)-threonylcarbamoyltransferase complex ATPase subunit type 1 TsaE [bacterium]|nr:tRNA (adenosine(37)-N6)-threonylcarbamoyltransferase complex ATPase subunit type 1 TsaE [bacterium]